MSTTRSKPRRLRRRLSLTALGLAAAAAAGVAVTGCSPIYVIKAGIAEARILAARRPIPEVILDPETPPETRDLLTFAMEARRFARDSLHLRVGDSYTSFTQLDSDTLALVLSASYRDRLVPKTWWFPIVGHVPYRGFFDEGDALDAQQDLDKDGFDTLLRPTSAFSTLGWFADPLLSSILGRDAVELVSTIIHELSHNHLFVPGRVQFNESFATFVGRAGSVAFFCRRQGGGPDTAKCLRAQARWRDAQRYSRFLDGLVADLQAVYSDSTLTYQAKLDQRQAVYERHRTRFETEVAPTFESLRFGGFLDRPLNNAVLLGQMRYYHRLPDFAAYLEAHGSLERAVADLTSGVKTVADPFELLPRDAPLPGDSLP